mgnify:CR=1 FL=1
MPFDKTQRTTRRRSSAGPTPPRRPLPSAHDRASGHRQGPRPTFLTLRDHGKVFVADLPYLSDGQLDVRALLDLGCTFESPPSGTAGSQVGCANQTNKQTKRLIALS